MSISWRRYRTRGLHDELIRAAGKPREHALPLTSYLSSLSKNDLVGVQQASELAIHELGISFVVYNEDTGSIDRDWPLDIIPRVMDAGEWREIEAGLKQRVRALNFFIADMYGEQQIVEAGVFPRSLLEKSVNFRPQCVGIEPPLGIWAHVCGSDIVRDRDGTVYVLEDNLRVPSGVSYMLENRAVMKRVFPELFDSYNILPNDEYPSELYDTLAAISPRPMENPEVVVLTPGIYNSAYFEHAYLAKEMGCELVEGRDLFVDSDDCVYMKTISGPARIDVIYRRIDDLFLDPEVFRKDSALGVPGLMRAWKAGNVGLANAPGAGVADDKLVYTFVPEMIRFYLDEEPLLPNVPTYRCNEPDALAHVLENMASLVIKPANESGGYGMLVGPMSSERERKQIAAKVRKDPRNYVAQPTLTLSTVPTLCDGTVEPRHVDLRPFILSGVTSRVTTGGLTRVALREGSLVVNSSQGGGSKDTWIVDTGGQESR